MHSKKHKENFDYYPTPHGIDYDDFFPGLSSFNPNRGEHYYSDYSYSDAHEHHYYGYSSDSYTDTSGTYESSFHDSHSGDAGYIHSHGLSHDSSLNYCGSGRCDSDTGYSSSHYSPSLDSEYPEFYYYGYAASSLASSDRCDSDLTDSCSSKNYSSFGSSGVYFYDHYTVSFDNSDIDSDGYLTTHSSSYSGRSSFSYGR